MWVHSFGCGFAGKTLLLPSLSHTLASKCCGCDVGGAGQEADLAKWETDPYTPVLPIFPCGFFVLKEKKKTLSKNRFGARVPMAFETLFFLFFPLTLVTQVAWQEETRERGGKTELVTDKMMRGVGVSLLCVRRKDCGKLRPDHPWSLTLFRGKRNGDVRASRRYKGFTGNPSRSRKASFWSGFILTGR